MSTKIDLLATQDGSQVWVSNKLALELGQRFKMSHDTSDFLEQVLSQVYDLGMKEGKSSAKRAVRRALGV